MVRATTMVLALTVGSGVIAGQGSEWQSLFDGRSLAAWRGYNRQDVPEAWKVVNGELTLNGKGGDLITKEKFQDFELVLEWKLLKPGANSGVFFHAVESTDPIYYAAPEIQLIDNVGAKGKLGPKQTTGSNYDLDAPSRDATKPVGEWNELKLVVKGTHVEHWINGVRVVSYELWSPEWEAKVKASKFKEWPAYGRAKTGHIGLQDHGDPVAFRNIRVRKLGST
jgi:hypothetical protein